MNFVIDTHSIVWYFTSDQRLSEKALRVLEKSRNTNKIIIPSIVMAEILHISEKEKIKLNFDETLARINECDNFRICPLDINILIYSSHIQPKGFDLHDRIIIATALFHNAALITKDHAITESKLVEVVW